MTPAGKHATLAVAQEEKSLLSDGQGCPTLTRAAQADVQQKERLKLIHSSKSPHLDPDIVTTAFSKHVHLICTAV